MLARSEKEFISLFNTIEDVREPGKVLYPLSEILFLCVIGVLSCAESWSEIRRYGHSHLELLRKYYPFEHGIPSKSVMSRVFRLISSEQMANFLTRLTSNLSCCNEIIALDGKRLRGSDVHLLHVFATQHGLILAQKAVANKCNESTDIPEVLDKLSLKGAVVTADALNCHKAIAKKIREKKADYFLAVKANQKGLLEDLKPFFDSKNSMTAAETVDKGHGRLEIRRCYALPANDWLKKEQPDWLNLNSFCLIESERHIKGKLSTSRRYYISSTQADPQAHLRYAREHWGIENNLHWVLDVIFNEDQATLAQKAAHHMAVLRKCVINMIKNYKNKTGDKTSIRCIRKWASWSSEKAEELLQYFVLTS